MGWNIQNDNFKLVALSGNFEIADLMHSFILIEVKKIIIQIGNLRKMKIKLVKIKVLITAVGKRMDLLAKTYSWLSKNIFSLRKITLIPEKLNLRALYIEICSYSTLTSETLIFTECYFSISKDLTYF